MPAQGCRDKRSEISKTCNLWNVSAEKLAESELGDLCVTILRKENVTTTAAVTINALLKLKTVDHDCLRRQ